MKKKKTETKEEALAVKPNAAIASLGIEPKTLEEAYRYSQAISRIGFIPPLYKGNADNCFLAVDLSMRWGVHWLIVMQHLYLVHERPALDAALCIALTNSSGIFLDPIEYESEGDDPRKDDYRVRAYAVRKSTGKLLTGPWIDWLTVRGEGWESKPGSKWKTMPDQMFHYRAASWFQRRYCPEVAMGMLTTDEAHDAGPKHIESQVVDKGIQGLKDRLDERQEATEEPSDDPNATPPEPEATDSEDTAPEPSEAQDKEPTDTGDANSTSSIWDN